MIILLLLAVKQRAIYMEIFLSMQYLYIPLALFHCSHQESKYKISYSCH